MSTLWNPTKQDVSAYNSGTRKVRIRNLLNDGAIKLGACPFCGNPTYIFNSQDKFITLGGSEHRCKTMRDNVDIH